MIKIIVIRKMIKITIRGVVNHEVLMLSLCRKCRVHQCKSSKDSKG